MSLEMRLPGPHKNIIRFICEEDGEIRSVDFAPDVNHLYINSRGDLKIASPEQSVIIQCNFDDEDDMNSDMIAKCLQEAETQGMKVGYVNTPSF